MSKSLFDGEAKGEVLELRDQLDSNDSSLHKAAAKRVVDLMRTGENVGVLFSSMLRCIKTKDMELKRLVYHYLVTYSAQESEQSIMAVAAILQDANDYNPLIRALAIRTMSGIRIPSVLENMILPLKKSITDSDPYVRKTAALAVAKLYSVIPESVEDSGLFESLTSLLSDANPMVISNTTAAILEINSLRTTPILIFDDNNVIPIMNAVTSSSEWCQTILFDALAAYEPQDSETTAAAIDRLIPYLKHNNPAVVIGAFKCIFQWMNTDQRPQQELLSQILPPFVSLVSSNEPEIQYVALRTLTLFVEKYPKALTREIRLFFCKYNEASFVKQEKLEIIVRAVGPTTVSLVLDEFREYCNSVDVAFVRKTIKCIGRIAMRIECAVRGCVDLLVTEVESKAEYAVEESIIVIADILRKYPGNFEAIIGKVCSCMEQLRDSHAKAALIWMYGEYSELIEHVDLLLDPLLDTFHEETPEVQLQLITALVKVYLRSPEESSDLLQFVLTQGTKPEVLPDVRNRATFYWRLLSIDAAAAKDMIIFQKDCVEESGVKFDEGVLDELMRNIGTVAGVMHRVPSDFVKRKSNDEASWREINVEGGLAAIRSRWSLTSYEIEITNQSGSQLSVSALAVRKNATGFEILETTGLKSNLEHGESCVARSAYRFAEERDPSTSAATLQVALQTTGGIVYFNDSIDTRVLTVPVKMTKQDFVTEFQAEGGTEGIVDGDIAGISALERRGLFIVGRKEQELCVSFEICGKKYIADVLTGEGQIRAIYKGDPSFLQLLKESTETLFCAD